MLSCTILLAAGTASTEEQRVATEKESNGQTATVDDADSSRDPIPAIATVELFPIPPGTVFERHTVGAGGSTASGERLVYSNTLGTFAGALGAGKLVADDIATTAPNGCKLRRLEFPVVGKVNPNGIGGPYSLDFALYSNCPDSVPPASRPGLIIENSAVHVDFPDDGARLISFAPPEGTDVLLPTNFWLGVKFSRANAGVIFGAPALVGYSADRFDWPGFACNAYAGGFPEQPHASFNAEIFGDAECPEAFVGYKNIQPSGSGYNPGADITFADDIELGVDHCQMIGYEVAIKGGGFYTFDLREHCDGVPIPGTQNSLSNFPSSEVKIARFSVDPPIAIPRDLWFSAKVNNATGGIVVTGQLADIGWTEDLFGLIGYDGCSLLESPIPLVQAALNLSITCAGTAPVGACCDMVLTDANGDAVCHEVPRMNCPWPWPQWNWWDQPQWVEGAACVPDPFMPHPCGQAACCTPGGGCTNLTRNECYAVPPLDSPRRWDLGRYCNSDGQSCPSPCLGRTGECTLPRCRSNGGVCNLTTYTCSAGVIGRACTSNSHCHCPENGCQVDPTCCDSCPPIGCDNVECCARVCDQDIFCCTVEWDDFCAGEARTGLGPGGVPLCDIRPANDDCEGARLITDVPPSSAATDSGRATEGSDPGFGCYLNNPGAQGLQTVWYKFVATDSSALIQTCTSNSPANDSLIAVFAVGDPSMPDTACRSLIPIACGDDFAGPPACGSGGKNAKVCLHRITPGNLYYVMVASKIDVTPGVVYTLNVSAPCGPIAPQPGDYCPDAQTILDGVTPFTFASTTMTPPVETCIPTMINDKWYNYTATCSGTLTIETCGPSPGTSPDTNLAIYADCLCPPVSGGPIACSADEGGNCGLGSRVVLDAVAGRCYKIRLADTLENRPPGNLKISCVQADCPAGSFTFTDPPNGVVDAGRPHDPNDAALLQGIHTIKAYGPRDALPSCFSLCETTNTGNMIDSVVQDPIGAYTITLHSPITAGALTTITYTDTHGLQSVGRFASHPGNVKADATTSEMDVQDLIAVLNGMTAPVWGIYSEDINRSAVFTPADVLEEIDLVNGAAVYDVWNKTPNPIDDDRCP